MSNENAPARFANAASITLYTRTLYFLSTVLTFIIRDNKRAQMRACFVFYRRWPSPGKTVETRRTGAVAVRAGSQASRPI